MPVHPNSASFCPPWPASRCALISTTARCHRVTVSHPSAAPGLSLLDFLLAIYLLTQRKNGLSALQLSRELGVSYNTAWKLKHKILQVIYERNQSETLTGRIEMDDTYLGSEQPGKRGRSAAHKFPFVACQWPPSAPSAAPRDRVRMTRIAASVAAGSQVVSDSLACFQVFDEVLYYHERHAVGGDRTRVEHPAFNWVYTLLGNVKNAITGTYHAISGKHAPRYLAEWSRRSKALPGRSRRP